MPQIIDEEVNIPDRHLSIGAVNNGMNILDLRARHSSGYRDNRGYISGYHIAPGTIRCRQTRFVGRGKGPGRKGIDWRPQRDVVEVASAIVGLMEPLGLEVPQSLRSRQGSLGGL